MPLQAKPDRWRRLRRSSKEDELRERIAALPEEIRRQGADPFAVDVSSILSELRKNFESLKGEELVKDAAAVNSVSKIVYMQDRWLSDRLKGFAFGPEKVKERLMAMDVQVLAACLYESQHLPVAVRHISTQRLSSAADYWVSLSGWGKGSKLGPLQDAGAEKLESLELGIDDIEEELKTVKEELETKLSSQSSSPIPYDDYIRRKEGRDRIRLAYIISVLCSSGEFTIRFDPSAAKYMIVKGNGTPDSSVAIAV
ncbi:MAG: hypothetical protein QXV32_08870 [Conexivisphaerales archaeon]